MKRRTASLLAVLLTFAMFVAGCGGSSTNTGSAGSSASTQSQVQPTPAGGGAGAASAPAGAAGQCPTNNTKVFAKTRFVLRAAEAFGVFHRYLYKPYHKGAFAKGVNGRLRTFVKAGLAVLFIKRQVRLATEDAKANATLCNAVAAPLTQIKDTLSGAVDQLKNGDTSGIEGLNSVVSAVQGSAAKRGIAVPDSQTASPGFGG